jgi:hypothetical protein
MNDIPEKGEEESQASEANTETKGQEGTPKKKALKYLGWANGWKETPEIVRKCQEQHHQTSNVDEGPRHRGLKHHVICRTCGYEYYYDSSD